jgi:ABC-type transport system involved in multi-copper enzyme maturation permease subunit
VKVPPVLVLVIHNFFDGIRARWVLIYTAVFFMLSVNIPMLVLLSARYLPPDYLEAYLAALMALSFPFLPLLSLPLSSTSIVDEKESGLLEFTLSNPISRLTYIAGKLLGHFLSTSLVILAGFLIAAVLAYNIRLEQAATVLPVIGAALLLNSIMLSLGTLISILSKRKVTALMMAIFTWFLMTVLSDIGSLSILVSVAGSAPFVLFLVAVNPIEACRLLGVYGIKNVGLTELGSVGLILRHLVGGSAWIFLLSVQVIWLAVLISLCLSIFIRTEIS